MMTVSEIAAKHDLNGPLFEEYLRHKNLPLHSDEAGNTLIADKDAERYVRLYEKALADAAQRQKGGSGTAEGALRIIGVFSIAVAILYGAVGGAELLLIVGFPAVIFATLCFAFAQILANQRRILANQREILKRLEKKE